MCVTGHTDSVASLAFSSDGRLLASGGLDGVVMIWDVFTGQLKQKLEGPGDAIEVAASHSQVLLGNVFCGCRFFSES